MTENLELREWIAVNLMGLRIVARDKDFRGNDRISAIEGDGRTATPWSTKTVPAYELTWNDAALVVEAMRARGYMGRISTPDPERLYWTAGFGKMPANADKFTFAIWHDGAGDSAPLAICMAAKAAIEGAG